MKKNKNENFDATNTNEDNFITVEETEDLVKTLLDFSGYDTQAVYGLMFLFSSFFKAIDSNHKMHVSTVCEEMQRFVYRFTENFNKGEKRLCDTIHKAYRKADFSKDYKEASQPFLEDEIDLDQIINNDAVWEKYMREIQ